jgi:hypothetical protein
MTRDQFIDEYCRRSDMNRSDFDRLMDAVSCQCGEEGCPDWAATPKALPGTALSTDARLSDRGMSVGKLNNIDQVTALLDRAEVELKQLLTDCRKAGTTAEEPIDLSVGAMIVVVLARCALDHVAAEIYHQLPGKGSGTHTPYFPIHKDASGFTKSELGGPGMKAAFPGLHAYLESLQPYAPLERASLGKNSAVLHRLCNKFKHNTLHRVRAGIKELLRNLKADELAKLKTDDREAYNRLWSYSRWCLELDDGSTMQLEQLEAFIGICRMILLGVTRRDWVTGEVL